MHQKLHWGKTHTAMNKGAKVVVFIIVALVLVTVATIMKENGAGAVLSVAGVAIYLLYQAMFKNSDDDEGGSDITLQK